MTRKERLQFCTICEHRKLDMQKGLLCDLTNEYAEFEGECESFVLDEAEKARKLHQSLDSAGHQDASDSIDPASNKQNGAIISIIGIVILLLTLFNVNSIGVLIIPSGIIAYGIRTYSKGVEQQKILEQQGELEEKLNNKKDD
ncbi:MAG: hypothetical protein CMP59_08195 [Flavobacteriales bacterium]|nr:hypothetical protein [Flavobacteriales bacterium]|tara:strand:- start:284 stop:712 length:429 start_codon:yes stop_codon:yes gene_type:complete